MQLPLQVGQVLSNTELVNTFKCGIQGGMRRSKKTNTLVLITDQTKIYHDQWCGNILHYTGMGLSGNQDFSYKQNCTLFESRVNGIDIHLFEVRDPKEYTYLGMVELAAEPYWSAQFDQDGNERKVCMFPLALCEKE